ncbi:HK97-gp10 family putative phage morphogenesis protein [Agrobacterium sp. rho-13.3]|uniref:HK97-gp10 family putative phage morphogenesis protein n=1 Tax=Agrobacterium sp. rho-13.3 TaxID=3072980 RepID=UPI002A11D398|nr:HK97-gp10 family putative phage morphogenesis protein [Agrobacterium sp. rho-13.3]MDX8309397.1 HK97 gp10 family phage protein [Agrobacterium sp. rho-13.3]
MSQQSDRLKRRLDAIPRAVKAAVQPALAKAGQDLATMQRILAPRDSGDLQKSIAVTLPGETTPAYSQPGGSRTAKENEVLVTVGNTDVRYPHLVEYGTATAAAQPYFWPGYRLMKKKMASRIKRAISKAVRDAK